MVDAIFSEPRLAAIYDALDSDRSDLDVYASIVDELAARSVLDLGRGTGTFACPLANRGKEVTAVDPAVASVAVAQRKAGAECVRWLVGDAGILPALRVDLLTMTGNVAQVFVTDDEWMSTLRASFATLRPGATSCSRSAIQRARRGATGTARNPIVALMSPTSGQSRPGWS